jgi:hypothetical protein
MGGSPLWNLELIEFLYGRDNFINFTALKTGLIYCKYYTTIKKWLKIFQQELKIILNGTMTL